MSDEQARVVDALVDFASQRHFPENESIASSSIDGSILPAAYLALDTARIDLESEIRTISRETAPQVTDWMSQAQVLQADIEKSRKLAGEIVKQAEADKQRIDNLEDQEAHVNFLEKEKLFNSHLYEALQWIKWINDLFDEAERLASEQRLLEALNVLASLSQDGSDKLDVSSNVIASWQSIPRISTSKHTPVVRLIEDRAIELRDCLREQFHDVWRALVVFDSDRSSLTIYETVDGQFVNVEQAVAISESYKELTKMAKEFWQSLDEIILRPRTDISRPLFKLEFKKNSVVIGEPQLDTNVSILLRDLEDLLAMLAKNLPKTLVLPLANAMMPSLSRRIIEDWLDRSVPSSLDDMIDYQEMLLQIHDFTDNLNGLGWPGLEPFTEWLSDAPKIWLSKKRETSLDWVRNQLALGVCEPLPAKHIESRMVAKDEEVHINPPADDWDASWGNDDPAIETSTEETPPPVPNRASSEEARKFSAITPTEGSPVDDDGGEAWGWGDDEIDEVLGAENRPSTLATPNLEDSNSPKTREVTIIETYHTSSMPKPVLDMIKSIYSDGAYLLREDNETIPISAAAAGLFSLPTLIMALYRAVSPFHYSCDPSGNMYMYNDSTWLCDQLQEYATGWEKRDSVPQRVYGKVKLDPEIKALQSFGKRAYSNEMVAQRTIISDLMGGDQNFIQSVSKDQLAEGIQPVVTYIREKAAMWKKILAYSAWASAVGSLVNVVAGKIISDVFDLSGLDVDEAEQTAKLISTISELDNLFLSENPAMNGKAATPLTPQFASNWMKMKFLSEVLQSNLADIRYLWFESELSLYFTKEETTDLIRLSFEDNTNSRQLIREVNQSTLAG